jgi:hypothetical protein
MIEVGSCGETPTFPELDACRMDFIIFLTYLPPSKQRYSLYHAPILLFRKRAKYPQNWGHSG